MLYDTPEISKRFSSYLWSHEAVQIAPVENLFFSQDLLNASAFHYVGFIYYIQFFKAWLFFFALESDGGNLEWQHSISNVACTLYRERLSAIQK